MKEECWIEDIEEWPKTIQNASLVVKPIESWHVTKAFAATSAHGRFPHASLDVTKTRRIILLKVRVEGKQNNTLWALDGFGPLLIRASWKYIIYIYIHLYIYICTQYMYYVQISTVVSRFVGSSILHHVCWSTTVIGLETMYCHCRSTVYVSLPTRWNLKELK